jgi:hypothetical protein
MRFRLGMMIGFGTGYYLGAKAGRDRYEQLRGMIDKARGSDTYELAHDKAKEVVDLTVDAAKDFVEDHKPGSGSSSTSSYDEEFASLTAQGI